MASKSVKAKRRARARRLDLADYGFARARDLAFDAAHSLWRVRRSNGMKQVDIAKALGRSPSWVNRSLRGPGNWTLRTFGELVEALGGEIEIHVHPLEAPLPIPVNYHAYAGYELPLVRLPQASPTPSVGNVAAAPTGVFFTVIRPAPATLVTTP
jgi:DNA-binding phage protein